MELDIRLLLTVAGLLVSVVAAAAVAKHQIKTLVEQLQTMKMSISDLQTSMEKNNISTFNLQEKVATLGRILSPEELNMQAEKEEQRQQSIQQPSQHCNSRYFICKKTLITSSRRRTKMDINNLKAELIRDEGLNTELYKCTSNKVTIGVGRNLTDRGITNDEAMLLLNNDISICEDELDIYYPWWRSMPDFRTAGSCQYDVQHGQANSIKVFWDARVS